MVDSGALGAIKDTDAKLEELRRRQCVTGTTSNSSVADLAQTIQKHTADSLKEDVVSN